MSEARVESVDAIKAFRRAWLKFAEAANVALSEAESDAVGTLRWVETEQKTWWQNQVRKTTELVSRCEDAVRQKRIFKDASGRTSSAVDEEKALNKAKRLKEHAEQRLVNVRKYTPRLNREIQLYKGQVQRLATFVAADIPTGAAKLDKIVQTLESYLALAAQDTTPTPASAAQPSDQVGSEIVPPPPDEPQKEGSADGHA